MSDGLAGVVNRYGVGGICTGTGGNAAMDFELSGEAPSSSTDLLCEW